MNDQERKIIKEARKLIEKGWTQRAYAKDSRGDICDPHYQGARSFCLLGALKRAAKDEYSPNADLPYDDTAREIFLSLGFKCPDETVDWNDRLTRTQAEVLARIDQALA